MVMYGEFDYTEFAKNAKYYLSKIPTAFEVIVPKADHTAYSGNTLQFHNDLLMFLNEKCSLIEEKDFDAQNYPNGGDFGEGEDYNYEEDLDDDDEFDESDLDEDGQDTEV
ncbi:hypothetical protein RFI_20388 [Reticulomyxa filosa]|uniref:Uncharacterized protein n=1 Tax=Reticulomyxa filosa TaxID=46433 RepID=X6MSL4_RETFI|nr:hypothetical protein RFI_20388 [Reticulomyxa filosa]|eukprot:ETO16948.1 hypothetical protein RFI_20388 [Reticulomyxa filosa]